MINAPALWPASLHHVMLSSEDPRSVAAWYQSSCEMSVEHIDNLTILSAVGRKIIFADGFPGIRQFGYALADRNQLDQLRAQVQANGLLPLAAAEIPFFSDAFGLRDPDGNLIVFGVDQSPIPPAPRLPGRLQHIVFATLDVNPLVKFYTEILGFKISDIVKGERNEVTACFMRSNGEHHSLAFFRADKKRLDHVSLESNCWNDIRDWGDHFATQRIPIVWGAGRHGAGNNLFIFVRDPMGTMVEISAEIEQVPYETPPRIWPHEERTINLWGKGMLRS
jgi:catechol 2,3-dioxygenase-like lactoylglutathione lyase family enzyme